jgi:hypothetical protein
LISRDLSQYLKESSKIGSSIISGQLESDSTADNQEIDEYESETQEDEESILRGGKYDI